MLRSTKNLLTLSKVSFPILIAKIFSLRGVPTSILINKEGQEFARVIGSIDFEDKNFINWIKKYN